MAVYSYTAKDQNGQTVKGVLNADDMDHLYHQLSQKGAFLIKARPRTRLSDITFERITRKDLISFTVHLSTIFSASIPLDVGLKDVADQTEKEKFRRIIEDVAKNVSEGAALSDALNKHPRVFSELYVNMIAAGEAGGNVEEVLNDLIDFIGWQDDLAADVKQALVYPLVILGAGILLIFFLLAFVLPRFLFVFQKAKVVLPLPTRILLFVSSFFAEYWLFIAAGMISAFFLFRFVMSTERGRYFIDSVKLKLPVFGSLIRKIALSRFSHYMGTLLKAGLDIIETLWVAERVIGNSVLARIIRNALVRVKEGESLSYCLEQSGEFPPLIIRMLAIGEKTSSLEMTLEKVSKHYDKEVPYTIKKIFSLLEPLLIIFLGLIVVGIALSMFLPMYQMIRLMSLS